MATIKIAFETTGASTAKAEIEGLGGAGEKAKGHLGGLGSALGDVGKIAGGFVIGQGLLKLPGLFSDALGGASDLNESLSKAQVVFGTSTGAIEKFAGSAATNLGLTKQAALEAAGTFGNLFTALGLGQKPAADMSQNILTLSADLASFNNLDPGEVLEKLRSGLVGEAEPLRSLGVNINETTVKAKAMELGFHAVNGSFTDAEKVQARYALILDQTKNAQGDFARTSDGLANSQRILHASIGDISAQIGGALLPAFAGATSLIAKGLPVAGEFVGKFADMASGAISGGIDITVDAIRDLVSLLAPAAEKALSVGKAIALWQFNNLREVAATTFDHIKELGGPILDKLKELAGLGFDKLKDAFNSGPIQGAIDKVREFASAHQDMLKAAAAGGGAGVVIFEISHHLDDLREGLSRARDGWDKFTEAVQPAADILGPLAKDVFGELKDALPPIGEALAGLVDPLAKMAESFTALAPLADTLKPLGEVIGTVLVVALAGLLETAKLLIPVFSGELVAAIQGMGGALTVTAGVMTGIFTTLSGTITGIVDVVGGLKQAIVGLFTGDWSAVKAGIGTAFEGVQEIVTAPFEGAMAALPNILDGGMQILNGLWTAAWTALGPLFTGAWGAVSSAVGIAVDAVVGAVKATPGKAKEALGSLAEVLVDKGKELLGGLASGASGAWESLRNAVWEAKDSAVAGLGNVFDWFKGVGSQIVEGMASGMASVAETLYRKAREIADKVGSILNPLNWFGSPKGIQNWFPYYMNWGMENMLAAVVGNPHLQATANYIAQTLGAAASGLTNIGGSILGGSAPQGTSDWQTWDISGWQAGPTGQNNPAVGTVKPSGDGSVLYQWNGSAWVPYGSGSQGGGGDGLNSWGQMGLGTGFDITRILGPHLNTIPGFGGLAPSNTSSWLFNQALMNGDVRGYNLSGVRDQYDDFAHGGHIDQMGRYIPAGGTPPMGPPAGYVVGPGGSWVPAGSGGGPVSSGGGIMVDTGPMTGANVINNYSFEIHIDANVGASGKDLAHAVMDELGRLMV